MIVEAKKSHCLPFVCWRPRKASGLVPIQVQRPENLEVLGVSPGSRAGEDGCLSSSSQTD